MTGLAPAALAPAAAAPVSVSSVAQLTLSLLAILALIFAIGWLLKRFKVMGPRGRGDIAVLGELNLSPRERVVLLRIGDSQVLLGIGAGGMVGLTPLSTPIGFGAPTPAPLAAPLRTPLSAPGFADRLREFMQRPGETQ